MDKEYYLICFGSFAGENYTRSSDIDIALYSDEDITSNEILEIEDKINKKVHTLRDIDVINLNENNISQKMVENIFTEGKIWQKPKNSKESLQNLKKRLVSMKK